MKQGACDVYFFSWKYVSGWAERKLWREFIE